jgi:hypothetical protein
VFCYTLLCSVLLYSANALLMIKAVYTRNRFGKSGQRTRFSRMCVLHFQTLFAQFCYAPEHNTVGPESQRQPSPLQLRFVRSGSFDSVLSVTTLLGDIAADMFKPFIDNRYKFKVQIATAVDLTDTPAMSPRRVVTLSTESNDPERTKRSCNGEGWRCDSGPTVLCSGA